MTLIAVWEANEYTITYDVAGGNELESNTQTVTYDSDFGLVDTTRTGYRFIGWQKAGVKFESGTWLLTEDVTLIAIWEANEYTITYDVAGGNELESNTQTVTYNSEYELVEPTRLGYTFVEWQKDNSKFENGTWTLTENITLTAIWQVNNYTITYDVAGGSELDSNTQTVTYNSEYELAEPTRLGYKFVEWQKDNIKFENGTWTLTENITLTAIWQANEYTITYNVNGGNELESNTQTVTYNSEYELAEPTRLGYEFIEWQKDEVKFEDGTWTLTENVTLTAVWEANEYTITYDVAGGSELDSNTQTVTYDSEYELEEPTRLGYKFDGWYTEEDTLLESGVWTIAEDIILIAAWEANEYTITYDVAGGSELDSNTQTVTYNSEYELVEPTRLGYKFIEWQKDNIKFENGIWTLTENVTLIAVWEANEYTITYDVNGGNELESNTQTVTYNSEYVLVEPTRTGYTFIEWQKDNSKFENGTWTLTENITLTAIWQANEYTITYDVNGGNELEANAQTVTYNSEYELVEPTRTGYTFVEWQKAGTKFENGTWLSTENITLTAIWQPNEYYVFYCINNEVVKSEKVVFDSYITIDLIPYDNDYSVMEWTNGQNKFTANETYLYNFNGYLYLNESDLCYNGDDFGYSVSDEAVIISDYYGKDFNITIPEKMLVDNVVYPVTGIGDEAFKSNESIQTVILPKTITTIGDSAFYMCDSLRNVEMQEGLISIGDEAFYMCGELENITLPTTLSSIGKYAFYSCDSLTSVVIPEGVTIIESSTFNCFNLKYVVLPKTITTINFFAFAKIEKLFYMGTEEEWENISKAGIVRASEIIFNATNVRKVEDDNFSYLLYNDTYIYDLKCTNKAIESFDSNVDLSGYVLCSLSKDAFTDCTKLRSVILPVTITSISEAAFQYCSSLTSVEIQEGVTSIGNNAFYRCSSLTSIVIPEGVISIGEYTFAFCSNLNNVSLPTTLTSIGDDAFENCSSLTSIVIPEGVTSIGEYTFAYCSNLNNVSLPTTLTSIGNHAFNYCSSLTSIVIFEDVASMGSSVFNGCYNLTIYYNGDTIPGEWNSNWNNSNRPVYFAGQWEYDENDNPTL